MTRKTAGLSLSYRLAVTSRSLAALLGGYLLASVASVCISLVAPLPRVDATLTGLLLSFVFYLLAFIWCFACRSASSLVEPIESKRRIVKFISYKFNGTQMNAD